MSVTRSALIGGTVMVVIAATFALGRGPQPVHALRDKPFQGTFGEDLATLAAASERIEALNKPRLVQVETVKPETDPLMSALAEPVAVPPTRRNAESDNICARHGMAKVWVSKYRWRCRR
jgi:hypothetical protein